MPADRRCEAPKAHCLRLLLPFFFERNRVASAAEALSGLTYQGKRPWACWAAEPEPHDLYRQEILPSVRAFLFGAGPWGIEAAAAICGCRPRRPISGSNAAADS